ncbi:MAG: DUF6285 domain-containing protein [Acidimicrobiia bacterium]|nr:DUF6285 domain-containing protein [Acidimicrobiia bacterium]
MTQDRPTATELIEAVRDFLERDVQPALEGHLAFHTRVAVNALGMVARELRLGPDLDAAEAARAAALLGHDGEPRDLERELASRIRDGSLDDRRTEVRDHVKETVRAKLEVANPRYLDD